MYLWFCELILILFNLQWVQTLLTLMQSSTFKFNHIHLNKQYIPLIYFYYAPFNYITDKTCFSKSSSRSELVIHRSWFSNQLCLFADNLKHFFVKISDQNFHSVRTFVFSKTTKFLFTRQFACILLQKVLNNFIAFA